MRRAAALVAIATVGVTAACASHKPDTSRSDSGSQGDVASADSIALERGACFGTCPQYRVRVARNGEVHFASRHAEPDTVVTSKLVGSDPAATFKELTSRFAQVGFLGLRDYVPGDSVACGLYHTDAPTVITTLYMPSQVKRVQDYQGCQGVPPQLRALEAAIDTAAGTDRWARPSRLPR